MTCELVLRHLGALVDGEVDPTAQIEFERHLGRCARCQEAVEIERALRSRVREALGGCSAPSTLRERLLVELERAAEIERVGARDASERERPLVRLVPMRMRHALPLAAAAAAMVVFSGSLSRRGGGAVDEASAVPAFEDVVRLHSSALPPDVDGARPQQVSNYFRNKVEFPVLPAHFDRHAARLVGARLSNIRDRRAAALYYDVSGHRVTVVVFDHPTAFDAATRVELDGHEVRYRHVRGYTIPLRRYAGLTYAFTGDLDGKTLLELAASARVDAGRFDVESGRVEPAPRVHSVMGRDAPESDAFGLRSEAAQRRNGTSESRGLARALDADGRAYGTGMANAPGIAGAAGGSRDVTLVRGRRDSSTDALDGQLPIGTTSPLPRTGGPRTGGRVHSVPVSHVGYATP